MRFGQIKFTCGSEIVNIYCMGSKISVVINTLNEEQNIERAIRSVRWADEVVVCDMHSDDKTVELAKRLGVKVVYHERANYVEPARNFAVSQASGDWTLILDADEEISEVLASRLQEIAKSEDGVDFVEIPRKNIIFNKHVKASLWWPDYHPRFYRKEKVLWKKEIHSKPGTKGKGLILPAEENLAIIHHHYQSIGQFIERVNRYTTIQAEELVKTGYKFRWEDLFSKPLEEFLGRFFANRGFEDGLHGLALSLLQAFSFLVMYLKVWEKEKFTPQDIAFSEVKKLSQKSGKEINYWFKYGNLSSNSIKRLFQRIGNKVL